MNKKDDPKEKDSIAFKQLKKQSEKIIQNVVDSIKRGDPTNKGIIKMLNIPRQKVLERWDELPLSIREALFSEEYDDALERIGEGNSLNEEQAEFLYTDVGDVLRGFLKPTELPKMLEEDLHIPPDIATLISEEVRIKIFDPFGSE